MWRQYIINDIGPAIWEDEGEPEGILQFEDPIGDIHFAPPQSIIKRLKNAINETTEIAEEINEKMADVTLNRRTYRELFYRIKRIADFNRLKWSHSKYHPRKIIRPYGPIRGNLHYGNWLNRMILDLDKWCRKHLKTLRRREEVNKASDAYWLDNWKQELTDEIKRRGWGP